LSTSWRTAGSNPSRVIGCGTCVTQEFQTIGRISAISSWLFSRGSYEGSFRGELEKFGRIAERESREPS